ncbi:hypothetical protein KMW28_13185 [Flammeovirga yaeyamensis]|uniref:DUF748 domain-containing protein n=1 Tax=Flammeovirga yaeyamensis TaxID=367791 RepID=A0AAX1N373_9BACT|nr:hypothetical protein [Flammeovirga yaeyamensis]MBB3700845.1 hypothetical protein [Flammeovirga yaeyamensis]NMF37953.1 hypothetical protein [Flammeovirga yaeyamensis]QWG00605.1 hypothetical protein KMW28_13185 [Flammeovirga yaeyamensis]
MDKENPVHNDQQKSKNDLPKKAKSLGRRVANAVLYSFIGLIVLLFIIFGVVHVALNNYAEEIVGEIVLKKGVATATKNKYSVQYDDLDVKLIAGWSIHDFLSSGSITLNNVRFIPDSVFVAKNDSLPWNQKENLIDIHAQNINLQNISLLRAVFQKEIYVGNIVFNGIEAEIHKYKFGKVEETKLKDTDKEKFEGLKKFFVKQKKNFNRYRIGNIEIIDSKIDFIDHTKSTEQQVNIGKLDTKINDVYLDSSTLYQELVPFHVGALEFESQDLKLELEKSPIGISLRKFYFSSYDSSLTVYNTSLYKISDKKTPISGATIPLLSLEGIDIKSFLYDSIVDIRRIEVSQPRVELNLGSTGNKKKLKKKKSEPLPPFIKYIHVQEFSLNNANVPLESPSLGKREIKDFSTHINDITVNNSTLKNKIPLLFSQFDFVLKNQSWSLNNGHYVSVGSVHYHSKYQNLRVYRPYYAPYRISNEVGENAKIKASAKSLKMAKVDYRTFLQQPLDSLLALNTMELNQPNVEVWLPKKKEKSKKTQTPRKYQFIKINSTSINKAKVTLHLPEDSLYNDKKVAVQNFKLHLDTLLLPIHDPLNFKVSNGDVKLYDVQVEDVVDYDIILDKAAFTLADSSFEVHGVNISSQHTENNKVKINTFVDVVFIEQISWRKFLATDSLSVERIFIDIPSADINLPLKQLQEEADATKIKETFVENKPKKTPFKHLQINQFIFLKGPLSVYNPDQSLLVQSNSSGITMDNFRLDKDSINWDELTFQLHDLYFPFEKIHHQARVSEVKLKSSTQDLIIDGLTITPTNEKLNKNYHLLCGINEINVKGIDYHLLTNLKQVVADEINIDGLRGIISINLPQKDSTKVEKKPKVKEKKPLPLQYINVGKINLTADDIALLVNNGPQKNNFVTFYGGEFQLSKIKSYPDSVNHIGDIRPEDFYVTFKGLQLESDENPMKITSSLFVADSKGDSLYLKNTNFTPKMAFQNVANLDSVMSLAIGDLKLKGAGIKPLLFEKKIDVDSVLGKNIYYITPAKRKKKEVKEGTFAEKNFPKEKIEDLLTKFTSIHVGYIDIDSSQISFRSPKQTNTYSRLMEREKSTVVLKQSNITQAKVKRKSERIRRKTKLSKDEKLDLINQILKDTIGQTVEIYPLIPTVLDTAVVKTHKESLLARSSENSLKNIHVTLKEFDINQELLQKEYYVGLKSAVAQVGKNSINLSNGMYSINFDSLSYNSQYQDIYVKNFEVDPNYSKKDFGVVNEFQTDRIEVNIPDLLVRGIHFKKYVYRDSLHLNGLEIDQLNLSAYRDKSIPVDPFKKQPKMPHTLFEEAPITFNLDSITITDSSIDYEEFKGAVENAQMDIDSTGGRSGQFQLNNFTGQIFNITNNTSTLDSIPFAEMFVKGTLMNNGGDLKMYLRMPPLDSLGTYYYEGEVGEMDLVKLNPLIERLEMIKVKDGHLKRMYFKVLADDSLAVGNMQFRYKNLEVDVLKEKEKKDGNLKRNAFFSSVANLLIREENPRFPSMKQGHIYNVRNQNKFIFNYWVKTVLSGVASTLSPLMEPNLKFEIDPVTKEVLRKRTPEEIKELKIEIRYIEKNTKRKQRLKGPLKKVY